MISCPIPSSCSLEHCPACTVLPYEHCLRENDRETAKNSGGSGHPPASPDLEDRARPWHATDAQRIHALGPAVQPRRFESRRGPECPGSSAQSWSGTSTAILARDYESEGGEADDGGGAEDEEDLGLEAEIGSPMLHNDPIPPSMAVMYDSALVALVGRCAQENLRRVGHKENVISCPLPGDDILFVQQLPPAVLARNAFPVMVYKLGCLEDQLSIDAVRHTRATVVAVNEAVRFVFGWDPAELIDLFGQACVQYVICPEDIGQLVTAQLECMVDQNPRETFAVHVRVLEVSESGRLRYWPCCVTGRVGTFIGCESYGLFVSSCCHLYAPRRFAARLVSCDMWCVP